MVLKSTSNKILMYVQHQPRPIMGQAAEQHNKLTMKLSLSDKMPCDIDFFTAEVKRYGYKEAMRMHEEQVYLSEIVTDLLERDPEQHIN